VSEPIEIETIIVGAGFAGLGMACRLVKERRPFLILERAADIGGTWRDNKYPGVASDIPAHLYSFSFSPNPDWSSHYAQGPEIHGYLKSTATSFSLLQHIRLGRDVVSIDWEMDRSRWSVRTCNESYRCNFLIIAVGRLSEARIPEIPGLDDFPGEAFHSSQWNDQVDLVSARVGVVGTGASAVQLTPYVARAARQVVIFQRNAPYILPRRDFKYTAENKSQFRRSPQQMSRLRSQLFQEAEAGFAARLTGSAESVDLQQQARKHLRAQVASAQLRRRLTPSYGIGCKRVLLSNDYYPALCRQEVTLEPSALKALRGRTAIAAGGATYDLDVIVLATGFHTTRLPFATMVRGENGRLLAKSWDSGMEAYNSTTVHGFPNMFIIGGPNAALGHNSAIVLIESQISYIAKCMTYLYSEGFDILEVKADAQYQYRQLIDQQSSKTVWTTGGCSSWYLDNRSNRLTLLWPDLASKFQERLGAFDPNAYSFRQYT
jgi:cation diffusion facilitator CzcD-associated flavoprotein CzcO